MMIDEKISKVLEHVEVSPSREEVAATIVQQILDECDIDDLQQMAEAHLEQEYETYTKAQLREQMEFYGWDDMLEETELWKHEKGDE
tara:strand:- start:52 stop:312 length:261 start_codon:yes stop_codon:yes gene_type:complete